MIVLEEYVSAFLLMEDYSLVDRQG